MLKKISTIDCVWVLGVALIACLALPNYIARELFAALLLFSILFVLGAALLGGVIFAWHLGKRFAGWERLRNFGTGVRRYTTDVVFRTPAA